MFRFVSLNKDEDKQNSMFEELNALAFNLYSFPSIKPTVLSLYPIFSLILSISERFLEKNLHLLLQLFHLFF